MQRLPLPLGWSDRWIRNRIVDVEPELQLEVHFHSDYSAVELDMPGVGLMYISVLDRCLAYRQSSDGWHLLLQPIGDAGRTDEDARVVSQGIVAVTLCSTQQPFLPWAVVVQIAPFSGKATLSADLPLRAWRV